MPTVIARTQEHDPGGATRVVELDLTASRLVRARLRAAEADLAYTDGAQAPLGIALLEVPARAIVVSMWVEELAPLEVTPTPEAAELVLYFGQPGDELDEASYWLALDLLEDPDAGLPTRARRRSSAAADPLVARLRLAGEGPFEVAAGEWEVLAQIAESEVVRP